MRQEGARRCWPCRSYGPLLLLWLATLDAGDWVALEDLAAYLAELSPRWDRPTFRSPLAALSSSHQRGRPPKAKSVKNRRPVGSGSDASALESVLLGAAYQLGLVRVAEECRLGGEWSRSRHSAAISWPLGHRLHHVRVRALPLRAAQLRDHRLSAGAYPDADRAVQPVRALVSARCGTGAEAHARVGLSTGSKGG